MHWLSNWQVPTVLATVAAETAMLGVGSQAQDSPRQTAASHAALGCIVGAPRLLLASTAAQESISKVLARHLAAPAALVSTSSTQALVAAEAVLLVATSHTRSRAQLVVASPAVLASINLHLVRLRAIAVRLGNIRDPRRRLGALRVRRGVIRMPAARAVARDVVLDVGNRTQGKPRLVAACAALDNFKVLLDNLHAQAAVPDSTKGLPDKHHASHVTGRYQQSGGSTACIACGTGRRQPNTGQSQSSSCIACSAGQFQDSGGQLLQNLQCRLVSRINSPACVSHMLHWSLPTFQRAAGCIGCAAGKYQPYTRQSSEQQLYQLW